MGSKDYYSILGVHQLASDDEIKRAYKQKALKHHPDKNHGDVDAEKKFMDISEAYEMLSDPYKRSLYDRFGSEELRNYLGTDPRTNFRPSGTHYTDCGPDSNNEYTYDPYNNYFVRYKDPSTFYDLYVTLEEVNKGATRKMKITRKRFNAELKTTVRDEKLLEIQVKPGWKEGTKITFEGEGDEGDQNTIAGDIVFIIRDKPHPIFERSNSDLIYRVKLSIKQALLGTIINIPFLDSTKPPYQLRAHQEIITPQTEKRFPNEGLPYPKDPTRRGDLIVKFDILFPKLLNNEQRTLVDCCFPNSIDSYQPYNSVLHTTIIEQIQQSPPQPTPTTPPKSQSASTNNTQKVFNHHVNTNGHQKSPSSPTKSSNKIKISPVRTGPSVPPPPAPPSSPTATSTAKETVF
jgi:DnaJ-class molecular chaperone